MLIHTHNNLLYICLYNERMDRQLHLLGTCPVDHDGEQWSSSTGGIQPSEDFLSEYIDYSQCEYQASDPESDNVPLQSQQHPWVSHFMLMSSTLKQVSTQDGRLLSTDISCDQYWANSQLYQSELQTKSTFCHDGISINLTPSSPYYTSQSATKSLSQCLSQVRLFRYLVS